MSWGVWTGDTDVAHKAGMFRDFATHRLFVSVSPLKEDSWGS